MKINEYFKNNQPIFYQILDHCFQSEKIPHAFLLIGEDAHIAAHFIAKSLVCENNKLACDECNTCRRIDQHNYGDFIFADGKEEKIKKSIVEYIQEQFSKSSLEGNSKIYLLENIENSTNEAMNSILKILEEPIPEVYAIFTCQNINRVLPTIQSRCQVIQLLPNSKKLLIEQLQKESLSRDDVSILSELCNSLDECHQLAESELYNDLKIEVYHFIEDIYFHRDNLMINVKTHLLNKYKDKDSIQLFLNMLTLGMMDLFHVKQSMNITFPSFKELFDKINDDPDNIIRRIELILETEYLLGTNANILLLMDSLMYKI